MANAKPKNKTYTTPVAPFGPYPRITKPDFKFKDEGEFSVKVILPTDNPVAIKMRALADEVAAEALKDGKAKLVEKGKAADAKKMAINNHPYSDETDDEGNETGRTVFKFSMKHSGVSKKNNKPWKRWPKLFDAAGNAIARPKDSDYDFDVWSGSEGAVSFEAVPYAPNAKIGAGCKFALVAAQITKLVEGGDGGSADDYGFAKQDGGFSASDLPAKSGTPSDDAGDEGDESEGSDGPSSDNDDF